jgi:hypothetical protein
MLTRIFGSAVFGIDAQQITIEVHIHPWRWLSSGRLARQRR